MTGQFAFDLAVTPRFAAEDFIPADCNNDALRWIEAEEWPGQVLFVSGPESSGKTHLAHLWAGRSHAAWCKADDLNSVGSAAAFAGHACLVLDDAEKASPEGLFHLINYTREDKARRLLITSRFTPDHFASLPDLESRLKAMPHAGLSMPGDAALETVLCKYFADRQLRVETSVVAYLLPRMERQWKSARQMVEMLDALSLENKRAITVSLAKKALET